MTTFYSEHYGPRIGATGHFTTMKSAPYVIRSDESGSRVRRTAARVVVPHPTTLADADIIRIMDLHSSARLYRLLFSLGDGFGVTATMNVGLYEKGNHNDGALIDVDLFGTAINWAGAIARVDAFTESTTLTNMDRGQPLWYLAELGVGGSTYTSDPNEMWTITMEPSQLFTITDAAVSILCEAYYVEGN